MDNSPKLLPPEPPRLIALIEENRCLKEELAAKVTQSLADWAVSIHVHQAATKAALLKLGITELAWQQAISEARRSLPQDQPPCDSLGALSALLQELSTQ